MTDGSHDGPCLNYPGQAPEDYDEHDSCYVHVETARRRHADEQTERRVLEAIVRALAGADVLMEVEGQEICRFCLRPQWYPPQDPAHEPSCPWRLAKEWVAANPEETTT